MPKGKFDKSNKKIKLRKSLNPMREKLRELTSIANQRVKELQQTGMESKALDAAEKTQRKVHRETGVLFTSNVKSTRELNRELARVQAFLTDYTSTVEGAKNFFGGLTHELYFGGQYRADGGYGANPDFVSKEQADLIFEIYHKMLEYEGGWERVIGYLKALYPSFSDYGSEQLINAIYDMTENLGVDDMRRDRSDYNLDSEDLTDYYVEKAAKLFEEMKSTYEHVASVQQYGEEFGYLEPDNERKSRMRLWEWKVERDDMRKGRK